MDSVNTFFKTLQHSESIVDKVTAELLIWLNFLHLRSAGYSSQTFEPKSENLCANLPRWCQWEYICIHLYSLKWAEAAHYN